MPDKQIVPSQVPTNSQGNLTTKPSSAQVDVMQNETNNTAAEIKSAYRKGINNINAAKSKEGVGSQLSKSIEHERTLTDKQATIYQNMITDSRNKSKAVIDKIEKRVNTINEFSKTGKLPPGRQDALINKLLITFGTSLLGNPTMAQALSEGFKNSLKVIKGEEDAYAKSLKTQLDAEKAMGDLKLNAQSAFDKARREQIAFLAARGATGVSNAIALADLNQKKTGNEIRAQVGMARLSLQAINAETALRTSLKKTPEEAAAIARNHIVGNKVRAFTNEYNNLITQQEKSNSLTTAEGAQARQRLINKYGSFFEKTHTGMLDFSRWKMDGFGRLIHAEGIASGRVRPVPSSNRDTSLALQLDNTYSGIKNTAEKKISDFKSADLRDLFKNSEFKNFMKRGGFEIKEKNGEPSNVVKQWRDLKNKNPKLIQAWMLKDTVRTTGSPDIRNRFLKEYPILAGGGVSKQIKLDSSGRIIR